MRVEIVGNATLYLGDCRDVLPHLGLMIDAIITDPPYFRVLQEYWDNEWEHPAAFLAWLGSVFDLFAISLKPNGSLYCFASPQMAARVEVELRKRFAVLAMVTWNKGASRKGAAGSGIDVTALRTFWQASSERIIFAEHYGSDAGAENVAGYTTACEAVKRSIFGDYLRSEFARAGVTSKTIAALFPSASGGLTGCVSNWLLGYNCPTPEQYKTIRSFLTKSGDEYLKREYEDLRSEYEDLRRPFKVTERDPWSDVWEFDPPRSGERHPCEKPTTMLGYMLKVSTRPGALVLDAFMGSGSTGQAALDLGRKFIGIERDPKWFAMAYRRIEQAQKQQRLFT